MKQFLLIVLSFFCLHVSATDDPKMLIRELNKKFRAVQDYTARVRMEFDIPGVKMNTMNGKVFFKRPDRFRIRTKGIFFLPKQNPMQNMSSMLLDTNSYTSIISGYEVVNNKRCAIVNIIPLTSSNELILGKFWIDVKDPKVYKTQITTRNNGTIDTESFYSTNSSVNLPDKVVIMIETKKIRMSKMMSADIGRKSQDKAKLDEVETGTITLSFSGYKINTRFPDSELERNED